MFLNKSPTGKYDGCKEDYFDTYLIRHRLKWDHVDINLDSD